MRFLALSLVLSWGCAASDRAKKAPGMEGGSTGGTDTAAAVPATAANVADSTKAPPSTPATATTAASRPPSMAGPAGAAGGVRRRELDKDFPVVRALYVNRFAAQSTKRMRQLVQIADETEINALVIDMKDEFGLNFSTSNANWAKNAGTAGTVKNLAAVLDTLRAHKILAIARMVVFKDSVTARVHPEWTIRRQDNSVWRDKKGIAWVNPYRHELWDYNIGIAEELAHLGFGEVQFDYIRFPEPYPSLPKQVFPDSKGVAKADLLAAYLREATGRIGGVGARTTADIFGLVTTVGGPLEVGQWWEKISPVVDVVLPMVYPSHYPHGDLGLKVPNAEPYQVIKIALSRARERDQKLGIKEPQHIRPWLQAFTLGKPAYGPAEIEAQKKGTYDAGYDGWVLWNAGSKYELFLPALEKELHTRKR